MWLSSNTWTRYGSLWQNGAVPSLRSLTGYCVLDLGPSDWLANAFKEHRPEYITHRRFSTDINATRKRLCADFRGGVSSALFESESEFLIRQTVSNAL